MYLSLENPDFAPLAAVNRVEQIKEVVFYDLHKNDDNDLDVDRQVLSREGLKKEVKEGVASNSLLIHLQFMRWKW